LEHIKNHQFFFSSFILPDQMSIHFATFSAILHSFKKFGEFLKITADIFIVALE